MARKRRRSRLRHEKEIQEENSLSLETHPEHPPESQRIAPPHLHERKKSESPIFGFTNIKPSSLKGLQDFVSDGGKQKQIKVKVTNKSGISLFKDLHQKSSLKEDHQTQDSKKMTPPLGEKSVSDQTISQNTIPLKIALKTMTRSTIARSKVIAMERVESAKSLIPSKRGQNITPKNQKTALDLIKETHTISDQKIIMKSQKKSRDDLKREILEKKVDQKNTPPPQVEKQDHIASESPVEKLHDSLSGSKKLHLKVANVDKPFSKAMVDLAFMSSDNIEEIEDGIRQSMQVGHRIMLSICLSFHKINSKKLYRQYGFQTFNEYIRSQDILTYSSAIEYDYIGRMFTKIKDDLERVGFRDEIHSLNKLRYLPGNIDDLPQEDREFIFSHIVHDSTRQFRRIVRATMLKNFGRSGENNLQGKDKFTLNDLTEMEYNRVAGELEKNPMIAQKEQILSILIGSYEVFKRKFMTLYKEGRLRLERNTYS